MITEKSTNSSKKSPFGAYDIRGVYGENLTEDFAYSLGLALGNHIGTGTTMIVGHDARLSSPGLTSALSRGIEASGNKVFSLGLASTPRVYWHGAQSQFAASVAITASHLPAKHNGFKICRQGAVPISSEDGLIDIEKLIANQSVKAIDKASLHSHSQPFESHGLNEYVNLMKSFLRPQKNLKIIVDIGGSPVGEEVEQLLANSVIQTTLLDSTPDGNFSRRSPNPMDDGALEELCAQVKTTGANFGAAFDGDGDRIVFVDERGQIVAPDLVTALLSIQILQKHPGANIMYDLRSSRSVPEFISAAGGSPLKSRVGHSFIKADMRRQNVALAGELSSHYYWSDLSFTDNALRTLVEMINLISSQSKSMSELVKPLEIYANSGEINFKCLDTKAVIEKLKTTFESMEHDYTDGLTIEFSDWWFNARASHTEPLLRLCLGAKTAELMDTKTRELRHIVDSVNG